MKEFLTDSETMKVYVPLITGVIVFILTSFYNQWKERKVDIRLKDAYFTVKTARLKRKSIPLKSRQDKKNTLLICDTFEELEAKSSELFVQFVIIENISENGIFNVTIKYNFLDKANEVSKEYYQDFMQSKEVFYLAITGDENKDNIKFKSKSMEINYETSAGVKYSIYERSFYKKFSSFRIKSRIILGFIPIPILQSIKVKSKNSFTKSRALKVEPEK